jgi:hypothetical protein
LGGQFRQAVCEIPSPKNNQSKMDWRYGSSGRTPALQVQSPEFKPHFYERKKEKKSDWYVRKPIKPQVLSPETST